MKMTINGDKLMIECDISGPGRPCTSGKTIVLDSSHGNKQVGDTGIMVGVNVYRYRRQDESLDSWAMD